MECLNPSTLRRLQKLPQIQSVWEGDRRSMSVCSGIDEEEESTGPAGECIIWVDGSQGLVRAMDMVSTNTSSEAIVRTLLRAMENPQSPTPAARPQKIVVKNREVQFFLRGILQDLEIAVDYVPDLPLIDEIFRGLQEVAQNRPPQVPARYAASLEKKAYEIWQDGIWNILGEHQVIAVKIDQFDVETLYISLLGKLGMDYGVLMYRSLESLKRFRERIINYQALPTESLEDAFLTQDCLFTTYEPIQEEDDLEGEIDLDLEDLDIDEIQPSFGNLHPLEGLRSVLYEEEAAAMFVAMEALRRFWKDHGKQIKTHSYPVLTQRYRITLPPAQSQKKSQSVPVEVSIDPQIADELYAITAEPEMDESEEFPQAVLKDDLVPDKSLLSLGVLPWETAEHLRASHAVYQAFEAGTIQEGDGLPVIVIQTSKPKAKTLIQEIQEAGGLTGICFNPGEDPMGGESYELGIIQTENGDLHLLGEFREDDPIHQAAREKWNQRCQKTQGHCGLVIAMGLTGASRGNPQFKHMMALLEGRSLSPKDIGLGPLKLMPFFY